MHNHNFIGYYNYHVGDCYSVLVYPCGCYDFLLPTLIEHSVNFKNSPLAEERRQSWKRLTSPVLSTSSILLARSWRFGGDQREGRTAQEGAPEFLCSSGVIMASNGPSSGLALRFTVEHEQSLVVAWAGTCQHRELMQYQMKMSEWMTRAPRHWLIVTQ